jgi:hypothetical protein
MMHDQAAFDLVQAGQPLFTLPPLPGAAAARGEPFRSRAIDDLRALRFRQQTEFGHTPETDARLPLAFLPQQARAGCMAVIEDIQFNKHDLIRRHALKAASFLIALVDRLDLEASQSTEEPTS